MDEGEFSAFWNGFERDFDARLAGVFHTALPAPTHENTLGPYDFEKLAVTLVL
jgi:hypothetical protein